VERDVLEPMMARAREAGIEVRGISDHGFIHSIYFRDPDGYVVELTARTDRPEPPLADAVAQAHAALERWEVSKVG
jgi:catechol-2,3-dioxygenase